MDFVAEIDLRTMRLCPHMPPQTAAVIREVCLKAAYAANAAESAYRSAVDLDELVESTAASIRLLTGIEREARVKVEHFNELLDATIKVANITLGHATVNKPASQKIIEDHAPQLVEYTTIESVPPHSFALRDLVNVSLEVPVLGKISARGPILAVCELTEGCWISSQVSNLKLLTRGTQFLAIVKDDGKLEKICPYTIQNNSINVKIVEFELPSKIGYNVRRRIENIVGKEPKDSKEISYSMHKLATGGGTSFFPGLLSYLELNAWNDNNVKREIYKFGLPPTFTSSTIHGVARPNIIQTPIYVGSEFESYHLINSKEEPKFKILYYERSYRVLVAAPWDFELDNLRTRAAEGEQLNMRDEFERVLIGTEAPKLIYGRGVEFEHVLESQLSAFVL